MKYDIRWVPFQAAKPLLDRKAYAVLSDHAMFQGGDSIPPNVSEHIMETQQHNEMDQDDCNDVFMHEDEGADKPEYESSDDESDGESSRSASAQIESGDINDVVIGLKGTCLRYKVCTHCILFLSRELISNNHLITLKKRLINQ